MGNTNVSDETDLPAGNFSTWMTGMLAALRGERSSDVPCGSCTACCTSSQFIHIAPDETDTLSHVPAELLFAAPGQPRGHVLMGYDQHGHCPMLIDNRCSIYEHRPRTCRTYDCRIFPAAGLELELEDDDSKISIAQRAQQWRFTFDNPEDRNQHEAVRAAAAFARENHAQFRAEDVATSTTQLAVLAIEIHSVFLRRGATP